MCSGAECLAWFDAQIQRMPAGGLLPGRVDVEGGAHRETAKGLFELGDPTVGIYAEPFNPESSIWKVKEEAGEGLFEISDGPSRIEEDPESGAISL